jgi:uncharacterized membrane protein YcaP (DUF421 family)
MFDQATPAWEIVVRTCAVYALVLVGLRLFGKRQVGQLNVADLVMILLIANAVQNAMVGPDVSLGGGAIAAVTLLIVNFVVVRALAFTPFGERLLEGAPTLLIHEGRVVDSALRREGLSQEEIEMAIREHGIADPTGVRAAYLEPDGTVSIIPVGATVLKGSRKVKRTRQLRRH